MPGSVRVWVRVPRWAFDLWVRVVWGWGVTDRVDGFASFDCRQGREVVHCVQGCRAAGQRGGSGSLGGVPGLVNRGEHRGIIDGRVARNG